MNILCLLLCVILRGSSFSRRLRDREAEIASDERDRQRELEEIERKFERKRVNRSPPAEPDENVCNILLFLVINCKISYQ